ncbi:ATP-dependent helicase [Acrocarpospora phusangensis]|uniref:ATP-dependent helicase n=1 Tax=Acrocarpospora phusangensis TaxID=1070424 RepID=A0A919QKL5_9ACTN|nr:ATP-dependent helicase HrpB [Acrocarpospora phusangensis]GIH29190.1 ATP-dependent helicase [Acrocarpospora phusangensis]
MRPEWSSLPVRHVLPELLAALEAPGTAVLTAPPGTGKTTVVPLALAGLSDSSLTPRRVIVAEPRRIAVRAAARRMAWLLGERVGERVGFTIRGERQVSARTRVEVVTTGVLLRRLQREPELDGVDAVLIDECHERHLDADTALAFLIDVRATLRPDLRLLATSATADAGRWAHLLGGAPVVHAEGTVHDVEIVWAPPPRPLPPPHGLRVDPAFLSHVADVVRDALNHHDGDVLCFLPGVAELGKVAGMLSGVEVLQVHGQAPAAVQDAALNPGAGRRVILATSVAESSLTIPGVRVVVDSGLAREPRMDHARGLGSLVTVRASKASAAQRAGRAGREWRGTAYRCWSAAEHERLPEYPQPEIALADLTGFALDAACWGDPDAGGLALLDPPPGGAMLAARDTLTALGALGPEGRVNDRGRRMAAVGVHPRLARALIDGAERVGADRAAEVVALLGEQLPRSASDDLVAVLRSVRRGGDNLSTRWRQETRRLAAALNSHQDIPAGPHTGRKPGGPRELGQDDAVAGLVVALAYPERVARRRADGGEFIMASGTGAMVGVGAGAGLGGAEWVAVAVADRAVGSAAARVRQGVVIDEDVARVAAAALLAEEDEIGWRKGEVVARRVRRLGAIELSAVALADADVRQAVRDGLAQEGVELLRWTPEARAFRDRLAFCHRVIGEPWPPVDDAALVAEADRWLEPELSRVRRRGDLAKIDVLVALRRLVPWSARIEDVAPERVEVPSGSKVRIDYSGERPVLAVKLQELFGWDDAPRIAGVPLTVHLLSPAGRPAAVTSDLASFWREAYHAVRAELRGRYPRHPWPEDPATATATRRANPRR